MRQVAELFHWSRKRPPLSAARSLAGVVYQPKGQPPRRTAANAPENETGGYTDNRDNRWLGELPKRGNYHLPTACPSVFDFGRTVWEGGSMRTRVSAKRWRRQDEPGRPSDYVTHFDELPSDRTPSSTCGYRPTTRKTTCWDTKSSCEGLSRRRATIYSM